MKQDTPPNGKIHGVLVPCAYFLGDDLSDEKKLELWTEVKADNEELQEWIEWDINFRNTKQYEFYMFLMEHPQGSIEIDNGIIKYHEGEV